MTLIQNDSFDIPIKRTCFGGHLICLPENVALSSSFIVGAGSALNLPSFFLLRYICFHRKLLTFR